MELRVLRYFLAVAREESITAAAAALHVTQPTLSKQLMELESELGKRLFERGHRKITLTEEGLFLRERAQEIVDLADKTEATFRDSDEVGSGDVYIGGGESEAMRLIARAVGALRKSYPGVRVHLFSGNSTDVAERLEKGLLDFGVFVGAADLSKYDHLRLPVSDVWGLLVREDHPLAALRRVTPADLWGVPLLSSHQAILQNELSGWLGDDFQKLNIIGSYNLIYNASLMVEEGIGCALCLEGLIRTSADNRLRFLPFEPGLTAPLAIAWKKHRVFSRAAARFLETLQSIMKG